MNPTKKSLVIFLMKVDPLKEEKDTPEAFKSKNKIWRRFLRIFH